MAAPILRTEPKHARHFIEPLSDDVGLDMVLVKGGDFTMGSPDTEPERSPIEGPQRQVTVPTFLMGRYPVTQAQWRVVAGWRPEQNQTLDPEPSHFKGNDKLPVESVSWFDAQEFCSRLSDRTGRQYRLPSEAEWEYACRAGKQTPFYFGQTITTDLANFNGNYTYNDSPKGEFREKTTPVDFFELANGWGLSDMHGNVWEWCLDQWHDNLEGLPTDGRPWVNGDREDVQRVSRGGSWDNGPRNCRSAIRNDFIPRESYFNVGFRVMCVAPRALQ